MNKSYRIVLVLLSAILIVGSSCKSTRSTLKKPLKEYGFNYLYTKMLENHVSFDYLNGKFSIEYLENRKKTELRGQLRIKYDSLVWLSFSPALGIEAARISLSDDSVKFINRLNKTYFLGEYKVLDSLLNTTIDYAILQAMIIGNDITQYDVSKYRASIDGGFYRITIQERRKIKKSLKRGEMDSKVLVQNIWLDPDNFRIKKIDIKELGDDSKKLTVVYDKFIHVDGQVFPSSIFINIVSQKTIKININFIKMELNETLRFPFKVPRKYETML